MEIGEGDLNKLCKVMVDGVYPLFYVSDIRGSGCVEHYNKKYLWKLFNLCKYVCRLSLNVMS